MRREIFFIVLVMALVVCFVSLSYADYSDRPFHGVFTWIIWPDWEHPESIAISGEGHFILYEPMPPKFPDPWVGIIGETYDGRLVFDYNTGYSETMVLWKNYSPYPFLADAGVMGLFGQSIVDAIFYENQPFWIDKRVGNDYIDASISLTFDPAPVPEPSTMILLGSGLIGLAGYGRKKFFKK